MSTPWESADAIDTDPFDGGDVDVLVVGAGLTGLSLAVMLAEAGTSVAVLESQRVGALATGRSTAKVSLLQGARLQRIRSLASDEVLRAYVDANRAGAAWLELALQQEGVAVERQTAISFASTASGVQTLQRELDLAREVGLQAKPVTPRVPFPIEAAIGLEGQSQIDPMAALGALARRLRRAGGRIHEGVTVTAIRHGRRSAGVATARTTSGDVVAGRVVLATGSPSPTRIPGAMVVPNRSHAAAYRVPDAIPDGMLLSVDSPSRSLRRATTADGDLLIVGGASHVVGRHSDPRRLVDDMHEWTLEHWPGARREHVWSAQDYSTPDLVPWCGALPGTHGRVLAATGYAKWGMTNAVQCAIALSGALAGAPAPWAQTLYRRRPTPAAIGHLVGAVSAVAAADVVTYVSGLRPGRTIAEGEGVVHRSGVRMLATSRVDGVERSVSPVCPHLLAPVAWNAQDRSWDCTAHGSRFAPDGSRLEGPTACPLRDLQASVPRGA